MSIPGFTAEQALGETAESYEGTAIFAGAVEGGGIVPAFCVGNWCCSCTEYGCVCQPKHGHALM